MYGILDFNKNSLIVFKNINNISDFARVLVKKYLNTHGYKMNINGRITFINSIVNDNDDCYLDITTTHDAIEYVANNLVYSYYNCVFNRKSLDNSTNVLLCNEIINIFNEK